MEVTAPNRSDSKANPNSLSSLLPKDFSILVARIQMRLCTEPFLLPRSSSSRSSSRSFVCCSCFRVLPASHFMAFRNFASSAARPSFPPPSSEQTGPASAQTATLAPSTAPSAASATAAVAAPSTVAPSIATAASAASATATATLAPSAAPSTAAPSAAPSAPSAAPSTSGGGSYGGIGEFAYLSEDEDVSLSLSAELIDFCEASTSSHATLWLAAVSRGTSPPEASLVQRQDPPPAAPAPAGAAAGAAAVFLERRGLRGTPLAAYLPTKGDTSGRSKPTLTESLALAEQLALRSSSSSSSKRSSSVLPLEVQRQLVARETERDKTKKRTPLRLASSRGVSVTKVLDLDSLEASVLNRAFMLLLVQQLPAELVLQLLSRIGVYRDVPSQRAYEALSQDFSRIVCRSLQQQQQPAAAAAAAAAAAMLTRCLQTLPLPWAVDYVRRFGSFSKLFLSRLIERAANPKPFDFIRYQRHGGVRPLPALLRHPYRLSSYVELLRECSVKKYMYIHLKRHLLLPPQQLLQQQLLGRQQQQQQQQLVLSADPAQGGLLPPEFAAAEKMLQQQSSNTTSSNKSSSSSCSKRRKQEISRPPLYDLILAGEHMGIDYSGLLPSTQQQQQQQQQEEEEEEDWVGPLDPFAMQRTVVVRAPQQQTSLGLTDPAAAAAAAELELDSPPKERPWWRSPWGVRGGFFRYKGSTFRKNTLSPNISKSPFSTMSSRRRVRNVAFNEDDLYDYSEEEEYGSDSCPYTSEKTHAATAAAAKANVKQQQQQQQQRHQQRPKAKPQPQQQVKQDQQKQQQQQRQKVQQRQQQKQQQHKQHKQQQQQQEESKNQEVVECPGSSSPPSPAAAAAAEVADAAATAAAAPAAERRQLSVVAVGHVDAGKSTLLGQLLWQGAALDPAALRRVLQQQQQQTSSSSSSSSKHYPAFAWLLDEGEEERERGVTVDVSVRCLYTPTTDVVLLDTPGHGDFVDNLIGGASVASVGLWVVDGHRLPVPEQSSSSSSSSGVAAAAAAASAEHLLLLRALGLTHLVVAVTRQDEAGWCSSRFAAARELLLQLCCKTAGFSQASVSVVPVASLPGVNLVSPQQQQQQQELLLQLAAARRSSKTHSSNLECLQQLVQQQRAQQQLLQQWWTGRSLLETLELVPEEADRCGCTSSSGGFAAVVADAWSSGDTLVMAFKVVRGSIETGQNVLLLPQRLLLRCMQLRCGSSSSSGRSNSRSSAGRFVPEGVFSCIDSEAAAAAAAGSVLCSSKDVLPVEHLLRARLLCLDTQMPLLPGRNVEVYVHTARASGIVLRLLPAPPSQQTGAATAPAAAAAAAPRMLTKGSTGWALIQTSHPVCVLPAASLRHDSSSSSSSSSGSSSSVGSSSGQPTVLSRLILRDSGRTVAAGIVFGVGPP
ncbi:hypothetical protein Esti_001543 [Eimeria stiedai]